MTELPSTPGPRGVLDWYAEEQEGIRRHEWFWALGKPVIAAVQGPCVAWGLELAAMCDFIIASERARFGVPAVRHGATIGTTIAWRVGWQHARYLLFTGDTIDAAEALRAGLVLRVVPHDELPAEVERFARRLATIPPAALRLNKRALDGMQHLAGLPASLGYGALAATLAHALQDTAETPDGRNLAAIRREHGLKAFLEARDGPFRE